MEPEKFAKYYSEFGLQEMIDHAKETIEKKKKEKEDVSPSWTESQVFNYRRTLDQEIAAIEATIVELEQALKIKREVEEMIE